ncbi:hypothetical protein MAR_016746, partial [Mya arenaria]
ENFRAGKTGDNINVWETITRDKWILNTITGCSIELSDIPQQKYVPKPIKISDDDNTKIRNELIDFWNAPETTNNEFISTIFIRPKKDGRVRVILNLRYFNEHYVEKLHFKMESLRAAINMVRKDCYLASVDLTDAYYSIRIREQDRKYFRFIFEGQKWQFTALNESVTIRTTTYDCCMRRTASSCMFTPSLKSVSPEHTRRRSVSTMVWRWRFSGISTFSCHCCCSLETQRTDHRLPEVLQYDSHESEAASKLS